MKPKRLKLTCAILLMAILLPYVSYQLFIGYIVWKNHLSITAIPYEISSPVEFSSSFMELSPSLVEKISEVGLLSISNSDDAVVRLAQNSEGVVLAIYASGKILKWDLSTKENIGEFSAGSVNANSAFFSSDAIKAISAGRIDGEKLYGVSVWNTETGERLFCYGMHCPTPYKDTSSSQLYLDPRGVFEIDLKETSIDFFPLNNEMRVVGVHYNDCLFRESTDSPPAQKMTIDPAETYIAYVLENGIVCVYELDRFLGFDPVTGKEISRSSGNFVQRFELGEEKYDVKDMAFDPTQKWLSVLTSKELFVWDLGKTFFSRKIHISLREGNVVAFNQTGQLLALGTKSGMALYDTQKGRRIVFLELGEVTAIYFSPDNRMLLWGDESGKIHIWGVSPETN